MFPAPKHTQKHMHQAPGHLSHRACTCGHPAPGTYPEATLTGHMPKHMRTHVPTQSAGYDIPASTHHTSLIPSQTHKCASPCQPCLGSQNSQADFRKTDLAWSPGQPDCRGSPPASAPALLGQWDRSYDAQKRAVIPDPRMTTNLCLTCPH